MPAHLLRGRGGRPGRRDHLVLTDDAGVVLHAARHVTSVGSQDGVDAALHVGECAAILHGDIKALCRNLRAALGGAKSVKVHVDDTGACAELIVQQSPSPTAVTVRMPRIAGLPRRLHEAVVVHEALSRLRRGRTVDVAIAGPTLLPLRGIAMDVLRGAVIAAAQAAPLQRARLSAALRGALQPAVRARVELALADSMWLDADASVVERVLQRACMFEPLDAQLGSAPFALANVRATHWLALVPGDHAAGLARIPVDWLRQLLSALRGVPPAMFVRMACEWLVGRGDVGYTLAYVSALVDLEITSVCRGASRGVRSCVARRTVPSVSAPRQRRAGCRAAQVHAPVRCVRRCRGRAWCVCGGAARVRRATDDVFSRACAAEYRGAHAASARAVDVVAWLTGVSVCARVAAGGAAVNHVAARDAGGSAAVTTMGAPERSARRRRRDAAGESDAAEAQASAGPSATGHGGARASGGGARLLRCVTHRARRWRAGARRGRGAERERAGWRRREWATRCAHCGPPCDEEWADGRSCGRRASAAGPGALPRRVRGRWRCGPGRDADGRRYAEWIELLRLRL